MSDGMRFPRNLLGDGQLSWKSAFGLAVYG